METLWPYIFFSLVASAFFSGMEIAFISANRLQTELELQRGSVIAKIISWFGSQKSRFIAALLVGNNVALVVYSIYAAKYLEPWLGGIWNNVFFILLSTTLLSTIVVLIAAEFLPKTLFRLSPNRALTVFTPILLPVYILLWIPAWLVTGLSQFILRNLFKVEKEEEANVFSRIDLDNYIRERSTGGQTDEEVDTEIQILQNALEFNKVKARECMVPRNEITAISIEDTVEELTGLFVETGHSKIPVYRDSIDNIIGYAHSSELFKRPESIKSILLPIAIVPESCTADQLLETFISNKRNLAVVVDEFGGTAGMLTIEDVIEEIFGDIEDEHDQDGLIEEQLGEGRYLFSARQEIDYLNDKYPLELPESEEYDTLAGLILHHHEDIPDMNDEVMIDGFHFLVTQVSDHRIDMVEVTVVQD